MFFKRNIAKKVTRLQPASRWRAALEIHEILNRNNYFINKWTHEIQVIQSSITCDDVRPIKKWEFRPKKFKKSAKKVSKKGPKKGPKKGQYYSLKQKSEGHFSVPKKKRARSDRPTSTEDLKSVQDACTLAENRENLDKQTDKQTRYVLEEVRRT